jgi:hypothetical protein
MNSIEVVLINASVITGKKGATSQFISKINRAPRFQALIVVGHERTVTGLINRPIRKRLRPVYDGSPDVGLLSVTR